MKFGQSTEYNIRIIFLVKSFTKSGGKASPKPFYKKSKLSISLDQQSEMLYTWFLMHVQVKIYQNILKMRCWTLAFTLNKAFLKKEKASGTSLSASFSVCVLKKIIFHIMYY